MGGFGSGGARVGTGPKPKDAAAKRLTGSRGSRKAAAPVATLPMVAPPDELPADQRAVWLQLAPHAVQARTLTAATAESFRDLCRAITIRNGLLDKIQTDGWTFVSVKVDGAGTEHPELKKHPLVSDLRGWEQRVEAGRARFRLAPLGKEIAAPEKPEDPFAEFDVAPRVN
jgi:hypothetical protein